MVSREQIVEVTSESELRAMLGEPMERSIKKEHRSLHAQHRNWIAESPFCLIATSGADGTCDLSPKGDPAGFVHILDDTTLVIPDRPGNRRADGFRNILANPHIGLLFMIPGRDDTLRVNGRASLVRAAPFFDDLVVRGHRPTLAVLVDVEQVFFHCPKSFKRSGLWHPETWGDPERLPSIACIVKDTMEIPETLEEMERYYGPDYDKHLYT
jgi:PPOX class probable FMN-dependent enzyme